MPNTTQYKLSHIPEYASQPKTLKPLPMCVPIYVHTFLVRK